MKLKMMQRITKSPQKHIRVVVCLPLATRYYDDLPRLKCGKLIYCDAVPNVGRRRLSQKQQPPQEDDLVSRFTRFASIDVEMRLVGNASSSVLEFYNNTALQKFGAAMTGESKVCVHDPACRLAEDEDWQSLILNLEQTTTLLLCISQSQLRFPTLCSSAFLGSDTALLNPSQCRLALAIGLRCLMDGQGCWHQSKNPYYCLL